MYCLQFVFKGFHDSWSTLEQFYSKLSNVQHVDGEADPKSVYVEVERTLFETLEKVCYKKSIRSTSRI